MPRAEGRRVRVLVLELDVEAVTKHPSWPGSLHHRPDGISACTRCPWRGVATILRGRRQDVCPACGIDHAAEARALAQPKVGRNAPCPCGSGRKFKKCCL